MKGESEIKELLDSFLENVDCEVAVSGGGLEGRGCKCRKGTVRRR